MDVKEKRSVPRISLAATGMALLGEVAVDCRSRDISAGGCGIEIADDLLPDIGSPIDVQLSAPGYSARGWVRWLRDEGNGTAVLGVQFVRSAPAEPDLS